MTAHTSLNDLTLERFAHGELEPAQAQQVRAMLDTDPAMRARFEALEASNREILAQYPSHLMAVQIRAKAKTSRAAQTHRTWVPFAASFATAAAAALCLLVFWPALHGGDSDEQVTASDTRPRGDFLKVYRNAGALPELLHQGDKVRKGDELQLRYNAWEYTYGVIFSVDGRGQVTLHFPADKTKPTTLERPGDQSLPYAYRLDDAPRFERFFFVVSKRPIDVKGVLGAGAKLGGETCKAPIFPQGAKLLDEVLVYKQ